jgi:hypothetical protein
MNYNKILFLVYLSITSFSFLHAQDCKYTLNEVDKFSNKVSRELSPVLLTKKAKLTGGLITKVKMILKEENDQLIFRLSFIRSSGVPPTFVRGNKLILLLKNKKQIEVEMKAMTSSFKGYTVLTDFEFKKEDLESLMESDITDIRVKSVFNPLDITINNATATHFKCFADQ